MSIMGRPGSEDLYAMDNSCAVSDDGTGLNEMYSKHTINMPIHPSPHSPGYPESVHGGPAGPGDLDMNSLVAFDAVDPSALSPHPPSMSPEVIPEMHPQ
jgi:hypothetical protein